MSSFTPEVLFILSDKFFQANLAQVDLDALKHNPLKCCGSIVPDSAEILVSSRPTHTVMGRDDF